MADALTPAGVQLLLRVERNMTRMPSQTSSIDDVITSNQHTDKRKHTANDEEWGTAVLRVKGTKCPKR